jgi:hypothetical protein
LGKQSFEQSGESLLRPQRETRNKKLKYQLFPGGMSECGTMQHFNGSTIFSESQHKAASQKKAPTPLFH